ncbi:Tat pathway signal protein [Haladaptatus sp. YSMS36]|uniref:DUF7405 family protein n=1 Tax=Haladaptatus sp. YSMS36 TaxID=3033384 RepID=UPI0023E875CC|nr:Tat pathway signal protein [Haladaptatus sp. YSMS36]
MDPRTNRGLSRRAFVKSAVAIGGATALSACLDREENPDVPSGPSDLSSYPARQHAWNDALTRSEAGNVLMPKHHLLLPLRYTGDGPTDEERETVEAALQSLEHAYARGNDGLLFTVGYSPAYFDRFDDSLPESVDLPMPKALSSFEEPELEDYDAIVHLASDYGHVVLAAEEALTGRQSTLNGYEMDASFDGIFEVQERRTGFIGRGLPAENQDVDGVPEGDPVPEDSPLYMGFVSGFEENQATEDRVTIAEGPFAEGSTQHVSRIRLRLDDWYDEQNREERVAEMFCPFHAKEGLVEGAGHNLGTSSQVDDKCAETLDEDARTYGRVGHSQKMVSVREDGRPIILRRDFDSTDGGEAGVHFVSLHRGIGDFEKTREAMNGEKQVQASPAIRQRVNNGILEYMFVKHRANYLLPPRAHRALPTPNP